MLFSKSLVLFITTLIIHLGCGEKLVILRGYSSENKVELFDFDDLKPSKLLANYPSDENGEGQTWLINKNSTILSCGGSYTKFHESCKNSNCYSYSIKENKWTELKNQPSTQIYSGIYDTIPDVGPIVLGGYLNGISHGTESCLFNPTRTSRLLSKDDQWKNGPNTPKAFYHGCSAKINDDTTYVNVNQQAFMVNWKTMNFKKVKAIKESHGFTNRVYMACAYNSDSKKVIIAGGEIFDKSGLQGFPTKSVKLYDPSTDSYEDGPDLPYELSGAALSVVGKDIILSGGEIGKKLTRSSDLHKYSNKGWTKLPVSMRRPRSFHNTITLN